LPAASCHIDSPTNSLSADFVTFDTVASSLKMYFISGQPSGLPTGTPGSLLAVTCRIENMVNFPTAVGKRSDVSIVAFGANSAPLYIHSSVDFPPIFEQSLGSNRPRVCTPFFLIYVNVRDESCCRSPCRSMSQPIMASR
jgi:hypothetical protein